MAFGIFLKIISGKTSSGERSRAQFLCYLILIKYSFFYPRSSLSYSRISENMEIWWSCQRGLFWLFGDDLKYLPIFFLEPLFPHLIDIWRYQIDRLREPTFCERKHPLGKSFSFFLSLLPIWRFYLQKKINQEERPSSTLICNASQAPIYEIIGYIASYLLVSRLFLVGKVNSFRRTSVLEAVDFRASSAFASVKVQRFY